MDLVDIGEMQRRLSLRASEQPEHQFGDLYSLLYQRDWLRLAHDHVKQNSGSITAGCDGITMSHFDEQLEENLQKLLEELKSQQFEPQPTRRVYIQKANGKQRPLGIPTMCSYCTSFNESLECRLAADACSCQKLRYK
jgi:RNA-directed DNA polymerase